MNEIKKIRTVKVNERGQIVIPEEIRKDLGINKFSILVVMESDNQIVIKKEDSLIEGIEGEDKFWKQLAQNSLERAWDKEDEIWEKVYKKEAEWNKET